MKGATMAREIKARFFKGKIEPLEDLGLLDGQEVIITVTEAPSEVVAEDAFERVAGAWKGTLDFDAYLNDLYASRRGESPEVIL
jgi:hypothetical protein